jgi:hypothetical protein
MENKEKQFSMVFYLYPVLSKSKWKIKEQQFFFHQNILVLPTKRHWGAE